MTDSTLGPQDADSFVWCPLCGALSLRCPHDGPASCTGGGCGDATCHARSVEAIRLCGLGDAAPDWYRELRSLAPDDEPDCFDDPPGECAWPDDEDHDCPREVAALRVAVESADAEFGRGEWGDETLPDPPDAEDA